MKARQFKNGKWTISDITSEDIVALAKMLRFAKRAEMDCGNHPVEEKEAVKILREDGDTLSIVSKWEFFTRCLKEDIERE